LTTTTDRRPRALAAALLAAAALALGACSGGAPAAGDGASPTGAAPTGAPPDEAGPVRLVTHDSFAVSEEVLAAFEQSSGLEVETIPAGDAGALVNQLVLTKDNPIGDVVFGVDNTFASRALAEEITVPHTSAAGGDEQEEYAADSSGRLTAVDYSDVCVNADKAYFADKGLALPATLEDLAKPEYKDLLVVENPATASPGLAFLLATVGAFGEDGWKDYWARLKANGVKVVDGWTDAYYVDFSGPSSEGDRPLVVSYASSPPSEIAEGETEPATVALLDTCFRQVEYAGVLAGTPRPEAAGQLVDFLLSPEFQEDLPGQMWVYPVKADAALPPEWAQFAPLATKPFAVAPADITAGRDGWIGDWTAAVLG
jgi:thiamine transport system substrate-binding protein